jgi:hypothetical protein
LSLKAKPAVAALINVLLNTSVVNTSRVWTA